MAIKEIQEHEIGNYYEPYRRAKREKDEALAVLSKHKEERKMFERLVDEGEAIKIVTVDKRLHLTRIHYERIR